MTFSLLGADPRTGEVGIAVTSSSAAVAARCAHVRPGVGVAASQNVTDPRLGPALLAELARGAAPASALVEVRCTAAHVEHRQLAVLNVAGAGAAWSGERALGRHGQRIGHDCVAAGNLLCSDDVLDAIVAGFAHDSSAGLSRRLLAGLRAGLDAGGEAGPLHSAGLLVAGAVPWPEVDLRVDHHADPVGALEALWAVYGPQREDYIARALNPAGAPAYGVAGEQEAAR